VADYNSLYNRPNFKDSVERYATGVADYNELLNRPNLKDSVLAYATGDYNDLKHRPNIADSIAQLGFSGEYYDLKHIPSIADSINTLGFSGEWSDLKNMPTGNASGAIMYYSAGSGSWKVLEGGNAGDVLVMGTDGFPAWVSAAFLFKNMSALTYTPVTFLNYKTSPYKAADTYNMLTANGTLEAPVDYNISFTITPDEGWGVKNIKMNGVNADSVYFTEKGITYLEFTVDNVSAYNIAVEMESDTVTYILNTVYSDSVEVDGTMTYFTNHLDTVKVAVGYGCDFVRNLTIPSGFGVASILVDGVNLTDSVLKLEQIILSSIKANTTVQVTLNEALYAVGEVVTYESGKQGVIYAVSNGGHNAKIVSATQIAAPSRTAWADAASTASALGDGWHLPSLAEAVEISNAIGIINNGLTAIAMGVPVSVMSGIQIWTSNSESDTYATSYFLYEGYQSGLPKTDEYYVVSIKEISK